MSFIDDLPNEAAWLTEQILSAQSLASARFAWKDRGIEQGDTSGL
jgi:hypothetical protein